MKEDVSTDMEATSLTKIFKELAKLERDFRYQETLYNIRSEELEKATATNQILKRHLENAYAEIESLRNNVQTLDVKVNTMDVGCMQDKEFCDQLIQKLTRKISTLTEESRTALDKQEARHKQDKVHMQETHSQFITDLQRKHGQDLIDIEQELERERNHSKQLQCKLDFTIDDNHLLQDKLRMMQQEYLPMEAYKTQLKNLSAANEKFKAQCMYMKSECKALMEANSQLQKEKERPKEQERQLANVHARLSEMTTQHDLLQSECRELRDANSNLLEELELYKGEHCNVAVHKNIAEQNLILQELVKEMRKERMKCNGDQLQSNLNETEERIKRLEDLIHELKQVLTIKTSQTISSKFSGAREALSAF